MMGSRKVLPSQVKSGEVTIKLFTPLAPQPHHVSSPSPTKTKVNFPLQFTDEELREKLTKDEYAVTQKAGTEKAFSGRYWDHHAAGVYKCVVCKEDLFDSNTKFDSGSGWPSFYDVLDKGKVKLVKDNTAYMTRTEVLCAQCGAHLGHVFDDGPKPTNQRYCMNSCSLDFKGKDDTDTA